VTEDAAVIAAAKIAWARYGSRPDHTYLRAILEAAAPHLMAEAWDEGFWKGAEWVESAGENSRSTSQRRFTNPHRSTK